MKLAAIFQRINIGSSGDMMFYLAIPNQSITLGSQRLSKGLMQPTTMKPQGKHTSLWLTDTGGKI